MTTRMTCSGASDCTARRHIHGCYADSPCQHLFITCEGSGAVLNPGATCKMCHEWFPGFAAAPTHTRLDIIAMLQRGDYDA